MGKLTISSLPYYTYFNESVDSIYITIKLLIKFSIKKEKHVILFHLIL